MNFSPEYISWIMLLYCQAESTVQNRGWFTMTFPLGRGVWQGCLLSCYLFNFVSQITIYYLAVNGIFVWWTLVGDPASLYADNVAIVLRDLKQLTAVIELIQQCIVIATHCYSYSEHSLHNSRAFVCIIEDVQWFLVEGMQPSAGKTNAKHHKMGWSKAYSHKAYHT